MQIISKEDVNAHRAVGVRKPKERVPIAFENVFKPFIRGNREQTN